MLSSIPESRDLEDSPELLAPLVLRTDFLCDGVEWVEWWLWLWESGLRQTESHIFRSVRVTARQIAGSQN